MTALPETKRALVADLDRRIRALPSWHDVLGEGTAGTWYGRLLTSYVLLVDDESVVYLTGEATLDEGHLKANITSFTPTLLVRAKIWGWVDKDDVKLSVTAAPRSGLVMLGASGSTGVSEEDVPWPGNLTFTLTYRAEGDALALPQDIPEDDHWAAEQAALLTSLRADLIAES